MESLERPSCDFCDAPFRLVSYDYGIDPETGYHDRGAYLECPDCGLIEEL